MADALHDAAAGANAHAEKHEWRTGSLRRLFRLVLLALERFVLSGRNRDASRFAHYRSVFDTVELNAPFYGWPKPATVKTWRRQARPGFVYSIKVNGSITHEKRFIRTRKLVGEFCEPIAKELAEQMGCLLFQCPPSLKYDADLLRRILDQLDPAFRNVIEFRHRSWWRPRVFEKCAAHQVTFCSVSAPRLPDELIDGARLYVRFHGKSRWYRHDYTRDELAVWRDRISASRAREAWIYFNNDREGFAIRNARMLRELL
jgi:uncharacterized protein YecE (DUF72 family)